ncbi:MAG: hypothetical protein WAU68_10690 [Vitreimonas sp.]
MKPSWRRAALALAFIWFFFGGLGHFVWLNTYTSIVPAWMPYPREVAWLTGLTDIAGALGILWLRTRRIAAYALILYCLCVWPVHFDMLAHAGLYRSVGLPVLWVRLLFQPVLMAIIWFAASPAADLPKSERTPP